MRIGKQEQAYTAIATSDAESITIRGHDLCDDLIGQIDFTDYFWLLSTGDRPDPAQKTILNACLVAIAEHGLVPSVQAARMTLAAAPEAWQGAMAAGLLGMGSVVAGSSEIAGIYLEELIAHADNSNDDLEAVVVRQSEGSAGAAAEGARSRSSPAQHGRSAGQQADADRR
jgi:citrate synthase